MWLRVNRGSSPRSTTRHVSSDPRTAARRGLGHASARSTRAPNRPCTIRQAAAMSGSAYPVPAVSTGRRLPRSLVVRLFVLLVAGIYGLGAPGSALAHAEVG